MPGHNSTALGVWVAGSDGDEQPILKIAGGRLVTTQSKTMTQVQVDDDDPTRFGSIVHSRMPRERTNRLQLRLASSAAA